jgi:hypothetical protein
VNEKTEVVIRKTDGGWDVHVTDADDVVVRTVGKRITVAVVPDDDTSAGDPLNVSLG